VIDEFVLVKGKLKGEALTGPALSVGKEEVAVAAIGRCFLLSISPLAE